MEKLLSNPYCSGRFMRFRAAKNYICVFSAAYTRVWAHNLLKFYTLSANVHSFITQISLYSIIHNSLVSQESNTESILSLVR